MTLYVTYRNTLLVRRPSLATSNDRDDSVSSQASLSMQSHSERLSEMVPTKSNDVPNSDNKPANIYEKKRLVLDNKVDNISINAPLPEVSDDDLTMIEVSEASLAIELMVKRKLRPPMPVGVPQGTT